MSSKIAWSFSCATTVAITLISVGSPASTEAQVREYRRRLMGDIGYARVDRQGNPIVVINPRLCARMGPELCEFFRAHEYAHHQLGHFYRNIPTSQAEAEADRYAASRVSPQSRAAAQRYFASGRGASRVHGSSQDRLARVGQYSAGASRRTVPTRNYVVRAPSQRVVFRPITSYSGGARMAYRPTSVYRATPIYRPSSSFVSSTRVIYRR